jgi:large subunit ribosomal protein L1
MGKIRVATLGDEEQEKEQTRRAEARRQTKQSKKEKTASSDESTSDTAIMADANDTSEQEETKKSTKAPKVHVRSKRYTEVASLVDKNKLYDLNEAIGLVKQTSMTKFDGTVELHINLNSQSLGEKKDMRGSVSLPHGTGKEVKVVIADDAVIADIEAGNINFDILVAHPTMMAKLAKVARVLGPKGLMPNPKNGTVSPDPEKRAKELSNGQVNFKTEPDQPLIHMTVGKVSFEDKKLTENIQAVIKAIGTSKIAKITLTATMGPGIKLAVQ